MAFDSAVFLSASAMEQVTELRVSRTEIRRRKRRSSLTRDGKLNLLVADQPGLRETQVGDNAIAMADRRDYLARIVRVLQSETVDGVIATMDVLDDLCLLDHAVVAAGGTSFIDERLLLASLNRGGLMGTLWELDDTMTGPRPEQLASLGVDGGKVLLRLAHDDMASLRTLKSAADTVCRMNAQRHPTFLEPVPVHKGKFGWEPIYSAETMARWVGVVTALGDSSRLTWLQVPFCDNYQNVASATTLPILVRGNNDSAKAEELLGQISSGLGSGSNVRGALIGPSVMYSDGADPLAVATAVGGLVHQDWTHDQAVEALSAEQGITPLL